MTVGLVEQGADLRPSSLSRSASTDATIRPVSASVARWSFFQDRRVLLPRFSANHSPGPRRRRPVLSTTRSPERVEIVTRAEVRRSYTDEKVRLVAETSQPGETVQDVSRRHGVCASLLPVRLVTPEAPAAPSAEPPRAPSAVSPIPSSGPIEVVLRNGRVPRVGTGVDAAAVARLAAALEA